MHIKAPAEYMNGTEEKKDQAAIFFHGKAAANRLPQTVGS
jgi:hypothetical protein